MSHDPSDIVSQEKSRKGLVLITFDGDGNVLNMQAVSRYMACKDSETEISREEDG